ncbi:right-handed parallel beta-helix repeat-containing protein [Flavobacterium proteolyticum]|uniref:Right-handed parallel beta-helix repeat-containing protein n=1 Tax=Flavobacterium proteolyticum TaxID=2911683 RepID=A0ABR9WS74_9FLAO|nr:right-handed parallel beta-helix repeat-containing protein [Flavobacterium proteolyticum]MBE9576753.1 right-handed parallel beta-helix repeat-containing protein [Flavobacterium proteolyticum]
MRRLLLLLLIGFAVSLTSCRNDFDFESKTGGLRFSKDTVYLDTVFTNIGSSTYTLKVYNRSDKNISIPKVQLAKGETSKYRMMVDGIPGRVFDNVELLAKDSMFIFIEVTAGVADANPTDFLYTDQILFGEGPNTQKVELVTLIQDAIFLYPQKFSDGTTETLPIGDDEIYGFYLDEADPTNGNELHWTNTKPYVVYGYAAVPPNKTLVVDAGARVHFHAESGLIVANNASIHVNGTHSTTAAQENEVIFEGDRLEPGFSEVPGQWGTIWLTQGSTNNQIKNLTIKNATVGILVSGNDGTPTPTLDLENTQIYNCSNVGILARTGNIEGRNVVINNCGQTSFAGSFGGSYEFVHCTFANYWPTPNQTAVLLDDYDGSTIYALTKANFKNCIIHTSSNFGIVLKKTGSTFVYNFDHSLIKFADFSNQFTNNPLYAFSNTALYTNCLIATNSTVNNPDFKDARNNELIIGEDSAAKGTANNTYSTFNDILNNPRSNPSDMGAYNWTTFD